MKRRYVKLKVKLVLLVVLIYLLGCGALIYQEADKIRWEYSVEARNHEGFVNYLRDIDGGDSSKFIKEVYQVYSRNVSRVHDGMGFYSMVINRKTDEVFIEDQNFLIITKQNMEPTDEDFRVLLLEPNFGFEDLSAQWDFMYGGYDNIEIIGSCDETFVYLEELKWTDTVDKTLHTYTPSKKENIQPGNTVRFEEWAGGNTFDRNYEDVDEVNYWVRSNSVYTQFGDHELRREMNAKAKELCEQLYEDYTFGTATAHDLLNEGIFTSYVARVNYINDEFAISHVYVFHPVSLAIRELSGFFFYATIFIFIIIAIICFIINKAYAKQLVYENNRRELTRGIAHELKTPLAVAKGYIENWDYLDENDRKESSKIMIDEIDHMNKMVSDLLELSHLEANKKQLIFESVDLYFLTNTVLKRMKGTIEERGLNVSDNTDKEKTGQDSGCFIVQADLEMTRTVIVNFISNAVKYADKNIDISLSDNGRKVRFSIINDGIGINKENIDKVWDEFYRSDSINTSRIGGNGLGLSISKQILIMHKAKYGCKSENSKTEFWFEMRK